MVIQAPKRLRTSSQQSSNAPLRPGTVPGPRSGRGRRHRLKNTACVRDGRGIFPLPALYSAGAHRGFDLKDMVEYYYFIFQLLVTYLFAHGRQKLKKKKQAVTSEVGYRVRSLLLSWHRNARG